MKARVYISGKIGEDTTLVDVVRQFKSYKNVTELEAVIHSVGGLVDEGEAIYDYLKGLDADIPVTTITDQAYSIAAKIFAAGRNRVVEDVDKAIMIHFAWGKKEGRAEDFEAVASYLRKLENSFTEFYSEFLNVSGGVATSLLENETFLSGRDALALNFATEIAVAAKAVAEYSISNKLNDKKMTEKKKTKAEELFALVGSFFKPHAEMKLQDSAGAEIVFPDLNEAGTPVVGDKATIDGAPVPDGAYIMPGLDDATVTFAGGAITEIKEKETPAAEASKRTGRKFKAVIKAEEVQQISVWTMEVANTTFAVGDVVKYLDWDGNEQTIGSGEFQLSDGRRVVTDATGVIVIIKEAGAATPEVAVTEASLVEKVTKNVKETVIAEFKPLLDAKDSEIKELKAKIGSKELKAEYKEPGGSGVTEQVSTGGASILSHRTKKGI